MSSSWGARKEVTSEICRALYSFDEYMNAESSQGSCCVQTRSNVLWKSAAALIDILWQATLPGCWYKAPLIRLYLVPYCTDCHTDPLCDLEEEGDKLQARTCTHTQMQSVHVITSSHSLFSLVHLSFHTGSQNTKSKAAWDSLSCRVTHTAWSYNTKLYSVSSGICTVWAAVPGPWYNVSIGFIHTLKANLLNECS